MGNSFRQKIFGPALVVIGCVLAYNGFSNGRLDARLKAEGTITKGEILEHETVRGRKGSVTYHLMASYSPASQDIVKNFTVSKDYYANHRDGEDINIRYLPSDPETSQIDGQASNSTWEMIIGGVLIIGGIIASFFFLLRR